MTHSNPAGLFLAVFVGALTAIGCSASDEVHIEDTIDDLVEALNDRDSIAAGRLFSDDVVEPVNAAGDSSVVYRLLTIPGGTGFSAENVSATTIDDRGMAEFDLSGDVEREDEVVGRMTVHVALDLEKQGDEWRIVAGSDRLMLSGQ